jgi:hypothetical protein
MKGRCLEIEEENTKLLAEVQQLNAALELKTKENDEMQNIKVYVFLAVSLARNNSEISFSL